MFRSKWFLGLLAVAMMAAAALFLVKPAYLKIRDVRASQLANQARQAYLANPADAAVVRNSADKVRSALQLSPTNASAHRTLATVSLFSNPALSLRHWEQAIQFAISDQTLSELDRLHYVQSLILNGRLKEAKRVLEEMDSGPEMTADVQYNLTKVCYLMGETEQALQHGRAMIRNRFTPIQRHLFFTNICLLSEDAKVRREGETHVRFLLSNEVLIDDSVVWQMTQLQNLSEDLREMLDQILNRRVTDFDERIALVDYRVKQGLISPEEGVRELGRALDRSDSLAVVRLAEWCGRQGFSEEVVELMPVDLALRRKDWFLLYMKHLAVLEDWSRVLTILTEEGCPIEAFLSEVLKCEAFFQSGAISRSVNAWYRAKLASNPIASDMWLLIRIGDKIGLQRETERMLRDLVIVGETPERVLAYIASRDLSSGDYEGFLRHLTGFKELYGNVGTIVNDWAYYAILMDRDVDEAMLQVERLIEQHPEQLRYHMTWALGKIKVGQFRPVLARFQQFEIDWMSLHPKWRLILALALAGVGEYEQGKAYLQGLDVEAFNPFELELYDKLFYGA